MCCSELDENYLKKHKTNSYSKYKKVLNTWNVYLFRLSFLGKIFYLFFRYWLKLSTVSRTIFFLLFRAIFVIARFSLKWQFKILSFVNDCFCFKLKDFNDSCSYRFFKRLCVFHSSQLFSYICLKKNQNTVFIWK